MDVDIKALEQLRDGLKGLTKRETGGFTEHAVKRLAAQLMGKAIRLTPVGDYNREVKYTPKSGTNKGKTRTKRVNVSGKVGGTLRRGWTAGEVRRKGGEYSVDVINPTRYAMYVEYGHRTRNHRGWVEGRFMLTKAKTELAAVAPKALSASLKLFLESKTKGGRRR